MKDQLQEFRKDPNIAGKMLCFLSPLANVLMGRTF